MYGQIRIALRFCASSQDEATLTENARVRHAYGNTKNVPAATTLNTPPITQNSVIQANKLINIGKKPGKRRKFTPIRRGGKINQRP